MSKNLKTYLLLGIVLLIWGIIGFKVVKAISKEPEMPVVQPSKRVWRKTVKKKDTFTLLANYRDPFLGTLPVTKKKVVRQAVHKKPRVKRNIVYAGLVSQSKSGESMFFVSIDGRQHMISENQEIQGVKLVKGNEKSITVHYDGHAETILMQ